MAVHARLKHDATNDVMRSVAGIEGLERQVVEALRAYKQDDRLADIITARERAFRLRQLASEIAADVAVIADREVAARVRIPEESPATGASGGPGAG